MKITFEKDYVIETTYEYSPMRKNTYSETKPEVLEGREFDDAIRNGEIPRKENGRSEYSYTKKERTVERTREYKKLFNKNDTFEIKPGINVLVGDNGCGKSTLIKELLEQNKEITSLHVDMEKSNPNITDHGPKKGITYSIEEISNKLMWSVESHGETREGVIKSLLTHKLDELDLIILDEPEQGFSLRNQIKYFRELESIGTNVMIITHSKVFIEMSDEVFDVEKMKWIKSNEYLEEIYKS